MLSRKHFLQASLGVFGAALTGASWLGCATGSEGGEGPEDGGNVDGDRLEDVSVASDAGTDVAALEDSRTDGRESGDGAAAVCTADIQAVIDDSLPLTVKNHGHAVLVTDSDIRLGAERGYDLAPSPHGSNHQVVVTVAHFDALKRGEVVRIQSNSKEGHSHTVVLQCAN